MYPISNPMVIASTSFDRVPLFREERDITTSANQALIIRKMSLLCPEEREVLITQVMPIVTDTMPIEDRLFIMNRLSFIPRDQRQILIKQILCLVSDLMSDEDRVFITTRLSFMSECEREIIVMQALHFIKDDMSLEEKRAIIEERIRVFHKRYRFILSSHEIVENPIKILLDIFETLVRNSIELFSYSIEYIDAPTIDDGGLTAAFLAKVTESFCNPKFSLVTETELGAIPTLNLTDSFFLSLADQEKCFKTIGRFFSTALQQDNSLVLGKNFHPVLFDMIFTLTEEDFANISSQKVFDTMLLIGLLKKENIENRVAENIVQNKITEEIRDTYCINSKNEFVKKYGFEEKIKAILIVAKSLYDSLSRNLKWDTVKGSSPRILQEKIQGTLSKMEVIKALSLDTLDKPEESSIRHIKKWISETNSEGLKKLVEAISGMKTLSGTTQLQISGVKGKNRLPVFHICFSRIELSEYTNYEIFKEKLELSLDHCFVKSGFQIA